MKRSILILAFATMLAACSGNATTGQNSGAVETPGGVPDQARDGLVGSEIEVHFEQGGGRRVIRTASLQLHASDTRAAFDSIVALVESTGGFVANAAGVHPAQREDAQPVISIVVRIPAEELTATMRAIKESVDDVVSETVSSQDVSEQYIDLEARLTNLRALEVELRAMLEEVRQQDSDPEKVLRVFSELALVRGQIEQLQAQLIHLAGLTELATVEIGITQTPAAVPIVTEPWAPAEAAREAARSLVMSLQGIANWVISFVIYTLPVLILTLAIPVLVGVWVYRKWWRDRLTTPAAPAGLTTEG